MFIRSSPTGVSPPVDVVVPLLPQPRGRAQRTHSCGRIIIPSVRHIATPYQDGVEVVVAGCRGKGEEATIDHSRLVVVSSI